MTNIGIFPILKILYIGLLPILTLFKNMELKEFISNTLSDIMEGIADAQNNVKQPNALIVPDKGRVFPIEFEVELTEIGSKENGRGIGVAFANIGIGVKEKESESGSSQTRIKFSIPVGYPENSK